MKKILFQKNVAMVLMLIACCLFINNVEIFASSNYGVSEKKPEKQEEAAIQPFDLGKPDKNDIYNNSEWVEMWGEAAVSTLYSNKWFYKVKQITMVVTNNSDETLTIKLLNDNLVFDTVQTATVEPNTSTQVYFRNLKSDTYYCIAFYAPSDFSAKGWGFPQN